MNPAIKNVRYAAERLASLREDVIVWEKELQIALAVVIETHPDGQNAWARKMGITNAYASDLRNLRRKVSPAILEKVLRLT